MLFEDVERREARRRARQHAASFRVAAWSRVDLGGLGIVAALSVALLPIAFTPGRAMGTATFALIAVGCALPIAGLLLRLDDLVRLDERGLYTVRGRGSQAPNAVRIPLGAIAGVEVRDWYASLDPATGEPVPQPAWSQATRASRTICVRLSDGSYREVFARRRLARRGVILELRGGRRFWRPAHHPSGRRLVWTEATDQAVADLLQQRVDMIRAAIGPLARTAPTGEPVRTADVLGFRLDTHRRRPPSRQHERRAYSVSAFETDSPVPAPAPDPLPPAPPPLPELPGSSAPVRRAEIAATSPDLALPARYWTLASARSGSVFGRHPTMRIDRTGITFTRRAGKDRTVGLGEVDRFDITFASTTRAEDEVAGRVLDGNWRLVLFRRDGTTVPLSGLDHGYFKDNRLFWVTGERARSERVGAPDGSMPWPNEQPLLVAARLNAHLAAARAAAMGVRPAA